MQRNWIGRSEGAEFDLAVVDAAGTPTGASIRVFTTRPDTSFGMTFVRAGARAPAGGSRSPPTSRRAEVEAFVERVRGETDIERQSTERPIDKRGVLHRRLRRQPVQRAPRCRSTWPTTC